MAADMTQKDLVLAPNEFSYTLDETKGNVSCWVGPVKTSLSQSDRLVRFDEKTKRFIECTSYAEAIQLFVSCPEGWYVALKNPAANGKHPNAGTSNSIPEQMDIGSKVNITGPTSFALFPGQMAQVIKGHTLRSNQYLIARVYDADTLNATEPGTLENPYVNGQILIIKGTEVSFYIPPTGIEVKAIDNDTKKGYVRDAVTLERLEYCILKDENGTKRYINGPNVVFPKPTETFVADNNGKIKYRAIELSDISGVYVKVIEEYSDKAGTHPVGEELFITGKEQMIYYPRPEHAFITYGDSDKVEYHAIAIPKGQGRYVMNRLTGEIKTVTGPAMYLPDPRKEVLVRRTLTRRECDLWFPGNKEVLEANGHGTINLTIADTFKEFSTTAASTVCYNSLDASSKAFSNDISQSFDKKGSIDRGATHTEPRHLSFDSSKYNGAVAMDIWTGYAVNVISKNGDKKVILGPQSILLDYDQTLEVLSLSTGRPKTTDRLEKTVYLRHSNNKVSDIINVKTKDGVPLEIKICYTIDFLPEHKDKWFNIDNYVKHICDYCRDTVKKELKAWTIYELTNNFEPSEIIKDAVFDIAEQFINLNGMIINGVEVFHCNIVDRDMEVRLARYRDEQIARDFDLKSLVDEDTYQKEKISLERERFKLETEKEKFIAEQNKIKDSLYLSIQEAINKQKDELEAQKLLAKEANEKKQNEIAAIALERQKASDTARIETMKAEAEIEAQRQAAHAEAMNKILEGISADLAAAMNNSNNKDIMEAMAKSITPIALAKNGSYSDAINTLLRGTSLEKLLDGFIK